MRHKMIVTTALAAVLSVFAIRAAAQHEEHHPDQQATQDQSTPGMMGQGQGMTGGGMMGMMSQMTAHHQQMSELMDKLMESMKAIDNEKDPAALKSRLAAHRALLEQMHEQMMQQGGMMKMMSGQVQQNCSMMGGDAKQPTH